MDTTANGITTKIFFFFFFFFFFFLKKKKKKKKNISTVSQPGETVSGIGANRPDSRARRILQSSAVALGETVSGIGTKDITITTATKNMVTTTVTTKTAIKIKRVYRIARRAAT